MIAFVGLHVRIHQKIRNWDFPLVLQSTIWVAWNAHYFNWLWLTEESHTNIKYYPIFIVK